MYTSNELRSLLLSFAPFFQEVALVGMKGVVCRIKLDGGNAEFLEKNRDRKRAQLSASDRNN